MMEEGYSPSHPLLSKPSVIRFLRTCRIFIETDAKFVTYFHRQKGMGRASQFRMEGDNCAIGEEEQYIVEAILKDKIDEITGDDVYLVKWKGYEELTWECEGNFIHEDGDVTEAFQDYKKTKLKQKYRNIRNIDTDSTDSTNTDKPSTSAPRPPAKKRKPSQQNLWKNIKGKLRKPAKTHKENNTRIPDNKERKKAKQKMKYGHANTKANREELESQFRSVSISLCARKDEPALSSLVSHTTTARMHPPQEDEEACNGEGLPDVLTNSASKNEGARLVHFGQKHDSYFVLTNNQYRKMQAIIQHSLRVLENAQLESMEREEGGGSVEIECGAPVHGDDMTNEIEVMRNLISKNQDGKYLAELLAERVHSATLDVYEKTKYAFIAGDLSLAMEYYQACKLKEIGISDDKMDVFNQKTTDLNTNVTLLMHLAWDKMFAKCKMLLTKNELCSFSCSHQNDHPFCKAITFIAQSSPVKYVNTRTLAHKWTALHVAVQCGAPCVIKALLNLGAIPSLSDSHRKSVLHLAVNRGDLDIVKELVYAGANTRVVDKFYQSPSNLSQQNSRVFDWMEEWNLKMETNFMKLILKKLPKSFKTPVHHVHTVPVKHLLYEEEWVIRFRINPSLDNPAMSGRCVFVMCFANLHLQEGETEPSLCFAPKTDSHVEGFELILNGNKQKLLQFFPHQQIYLFQFLDICLAGNIVKIKLPPKKLEHVQDNILLSAQTWV